MVPNELNEDLKQSTLRVHSWNPSRLELNIALDDPEHMQIGNLSLEGVSHFCLPSNLDVNTLEISAAQDLSDEFWRSVSVRKKDFSEDSSFFIFTNASGDRFFVAASDMNYEREI